MTLPFRPSGHHPAVPQSRHAPRSCPEPFVLRRVVSDNGWDYGRPNPTMTSTSRRRRVPLSLLAAVALLATVSACQASRTTTDAAATTVAPPRVTVGTGPSGLVDWSKPMLVTISDGSLKRVLVTDLSGYDVPGSLKDGR